MQTQTNGRDLYQWGWVQVSHIRINKFFKDCFRYPKPDLGDTKTAAYF
jgi:hypothetical protein